MPSRYTRQIRLAEVGVTGQARLEEAEIELRSTGEAGRVESFYLEAAGARCVRAKSADEAEHVLPVLVRDSAAREVARGAHAALFALRRLWTSP